MKSLKASKLEKLAVRLHAGGRCARCNGSGTVRWGKMGDWDSAFGCYPCMCQDKPEITRRIGKRKAPADAVSHAANVEKP